MCLQVPVRADASDNGSSFVELQGHFNGMGQEIKTVQGIDNHDTGIVLLFLYQYNCLGIFSNTISHSDQFGLSTDSLMAVLTEGRK